MFIATFNNISVIGGGNRSTRRKPPTCRRSLTNSYIMLYRVYLVLAGFEPTTLHQAWTHFKSSMCSVYKEGHPVYEKLRSMISLHKPDNTDVN